jgi:DNA-binding MarR family transcriptional regulator
LVANATINRAGAGAIPVTLGGVAGRADLCPAAWRVLVEAHASVLARVEHDLVEACGLPLGWYEVLRALAESPGGRLRMHELAGSVLLSKSGLSRMVDRVEAAGHLRRERCAADRRGAFAVLTPSGRAVLRRATPVYERAVREHFLRHFGDAEARRLVELLDRVARPAAAAEPA